MKKIIIILLILLGILVLGGILLLIINSRTLSPGEIVSRNAMIRASLMGTSTTASLYRDRNLSYSGLCESNDIRRILEDVEQYTNAICRDTNDAYCISAEKIESDLYFCVDYTGRNIENTKGCINYSCVE